MNAESARQLRLLDLQAIDTRLDQIAHARTHLPQLAELADLLGKARLIDDQLVRSRTELGDVQREVAKAESDVQLVRDRAVLLAMLRAWRQSLLAGFMGALASQMWFLAFAIATTAHVRTLALVEILFAQAVSRRLFSQRSTVLETLCVALVVVGALLLING